MTMTVAESRSRPDVLPLLVGLAEALEARGLAYCQWKGNWKRERWGRGQGDLDLLVDPASAAPFRSLLCDSGFKPALPLPERQISGIESYFGFDGQQRRLVHLHVHYRLILGAYWTMRFRIPVERQLLASAVPGVVLRVPAGEFELLLFVLRLVLRYRLRNMRTGAPDWLQEIQPELDFLEARAERAELHRALAQHLPCVEVAFFDRCLRSLRPGASGWERVVVARALRRRLGAHAERPPLWAWMFTVARERAPVLAHHPRPPAGMRLPTGGTVIALLGADGAGKSTCARELHAWLSRHFATSAAHLGRPPRSAATLVVGGALKLCRGAAPGSGACSALEMLRYVCTARDRYHLYTGVRRFASAGGIAVCERYPVAQNRLLVGPGIGRMLGGRPRPGLAERLRDLEAAYYRRMLPPDVLIVLRIEPELAVRRKPEEPAAYVRDRARIMWDADWTGTRAHIVDAGRPLAEVLAEIMAIAWGEI
jgi:thymidylate kinase